MRCLITGVGGFVGRHLERLLVTRGEDVLGLVRPGESPAEPGRRPLEVDLRDARAVTRVFSDTAPDVVYHLAALTVPGRSLDHPVETFEVNAVGTLNVLEACRQYARSARVLVVSSSEVYGRERDSGRLDEQRPLQPASPYAASKAAAELLGYQYWRAYGLHVVRARPFNHTGPGQAADFVLSNFAMQLARAERHPDATVPVIRVGNLAVARDFTDVRDVVRAYFDMMNGPAPAEAYNVCSGRATRLEELFELLRALAGCKVQVEVDAGRLRPDDPPVIVGDPGRLHRTTGWVPAIPLDRTLTDLLDWWRSRLSLQDE